MFSEPDTQKFPKTFWWALVSVVPMAVGAFGPWEKLLGVVTISGTEDGGGWTVFLAALLAAVTLAAYARWRRRGISVVPIMAAAAGVLVTAYDLHEISTFSDPVFGAGKIDAAQWGIYVALIGSVSLWLASLVLTIQTPDTAERVAIPGSGATAKIRRPWAVFGLAVVTFGLYHLYWYYQVNRELKDFGVGKRPVVSLLAQFPGALLILPPVISWWRFVGRIRKAEARANCPNRIDHALGMILYVVGFFLLPLELPYTQQYVNALWRTVGSSPAEPEAEAGVFFYENYAPEARTVSEA